LITTLRLRRRPEASKGTEQLRVGIGECFVAFALTIAEMQAAVAAAGAALLIGGSYSLAGLPFVSLLALASPRVRVARAAVRREAAHRAVRLLAALAREARCAHALARLDTTTGIITTAGIASILDAGVAMSEYAEPDGLARARLLLLRCAGRPHLLASGAEEAAVAGADAGAAMPVARAASDAVDLVAADAEIALVAMAADFKGGGPQLQDGAAVVGARHVSH